jgi:hypothetical protein
VSGWRWRSDERCAEFDQQYKEGKRSGDALGERMTARRFDGQLAELQVHAAILNRFSMQGRPSTVAVV